MKVFSIIVTYNGMQWIEKCLQSLVGQSEVIVVDNYSTDETVSWIQANFADVVLLPQSQNLGFGKANNIGISYALNNGAEAVFLLNQDAYAQTNCVKKLVITCKNNPEYGIISPIHLNSDGSSIDSSFLEFISPFKAGNLISDLVLKKKSKSIYDIKYINAAAWFIPSNVFYKVGGFDPIFFMYGEDDNYCQRILFHNFKIGITSSTNIFHDCRNKYNIENLKENDYNYFSNRFKVKFANINTNDYLKMRKFKRYLLMKSIINLLKFKSEKAKEYLKKFKKVNLKDIFQSVENNKKETSNYLNIK